MKIQAQTRVFKAVGQIVAALAACAACGCDATDDAMVDVAQEGLGEAACTQAFADYTQSQEVHVQYPWPGYSNPSCGKSHVIDVSPYAGGGLETRVMWNDSLPNTQTACEATWIAGFVYRRLGGEGWNSPISRSAFGVWQNSTCYGPQFSFTAAELPSTPLGYRFAVSARTYASTYAPTRGYQVQSEYEIR